MNDAEYERKRALLDQWEEREREQFRKKVIHETVSTVLDATGITDKIVSTIASGGKSDQ